MTNDLEEKEIVITETGIDVRDVSDLDLLTEKIDAYIDWLYGEYDKYKQGEKPWEDYDFWGSVQ